METINLATSFEKLKANVDYEALDFALKENDYKTVVRIESPSNKIIGIEVECTPGIAHEKGEIFKDVFGSKFYINYMRNEWYFLFTLKQK